MSLLSVRDLCVSFPSEAGVVQAVRGVTFDLERGQTMALVGESGSGKSVTSLAIMGLHPENAKITGSVLLDGTDELLTKNDEQMSKIRGLRIAMVFQDPLSALTPVYAVGDQIVETILTHSPETSKEDAWKRAVHLLDLVGIPDAAERARAFPFEFSGGMRQRVMIAMAIANNPDIIIADEPTTALDVTIQAQVLEVLQAAQAETGAAMILITHDLGVVAGNADHVTVMYAGRMVEQGSVDDIFYAPAMPYTIGLLGTVPRLDHKSGEALPILEGNPPSVVNLVPGCPFAPRCPMAIDKCHESEPELTATGETQAGHLSACWRLEETKGLSHGDIFEVPVVRRNELTTLPRDERDTVLDIKNLHKHFPLLKGAIYRRQAGVVKAVDGIDLDLRAGETLGLVGESGSGKSTTLLEILELMKPTQGRIVVLGNDTAQLSRNARRSLRKDIQVVFQDPMAALDPRLPVFDIIAEPLGAFGWDKAAIEERVFELLKIVGLQADHADRYPQHFSGGQRQRIGIARALALNPRILVLDEPVSALDVSIQAGVINLLEQLQQELGLSYLLVAHDLAVIRHICDRVAVMYLGNIVEIGDVEDVYEHPLHPYTQALLSAIPIPDPKVERERQRVVLTGDMPSPADPPSGCKFRTRCPKFLSLDADSQARCVGVPPELSVAGADHNVACHYPEVLRVI
ncbi:MAG: ABC transporter ATP-binding protein [Propionibacteriaceae bacterium]|jgi:peptide/nickel transport system ATP-binding protein|nr:ABC transporter ATP-binding protein [Propionibacteriaceae bacterium]